MISICIYCGEYKPVALEACPSCLKTPEAHKDVINSIAMCFSEGEPHLNFLDRGEIEELRQSILAGSTLVVREDVFREAEEAYSAVSSIDSPQLVRYVGSFYFPTALLVVALLSMLLFF